MESSPANDEPNKTIAALSDIRDIFTPSRPNLIAGIICGIALIVGGLVYGIGLATKDDNRPLEDSSRIAKYVLVAGFAGAAPIAGIVLLVWMRRLLSHQVMVGELGFAFDYRGRTEICLWNQTAEIREVLKLERLRVLNVPGATIKSIDRSFVVKRVDGREFRFTSNTIKRINRFGTCLEEASKAHAIPWRQVEK